MFALGGPDLSDVLTDVNEMRPLRLLAMTVVCIGLGVASFILAKGYLLERPVYETEQRLLLVKDSHDLKYLSKDWTVFTPLGSCTRGGRGQIKFRLQSTPMSNLDLGFRAKLTNPRFAKQRLFVKVNDRQLGHLSFSSKGRLLLRNFSIPARLATHKTPLELDLIMSSYRAEGRPSKPINSNAFGICLTSIAISYQPAEIYEN